MIKRVWLFIATNFLIMLTIYFMIQLFGLDSVIKEHGIRYSYLAIVCAIWGTIGALLSLFLAKFITTMLLKIKIIRPAFANTTERELLDIVYRHARAAGLTALPEVGIYRSPELNAFAIGQTRNKALLAISSGLLINMQRHEMEGVIAHEISHIANGDMVTLTLIQGILHAFVLFLTSIISYGISLCLALRRGHEKENVRISMLSYRLLTMMLSFSFTFLGSLMVSAFSRQREFLADASSAELVGRDNMVATLRKLQIANELEEDQPSLLTIFKMTRRPHVLNLFSTHPTIEKRIAHLMRTPKFKR
ncbi:MAG: protease HtpX [Gammaproteobacteria bacterium]|nr:protease HtpX [Gammaproteobacteria bacterium]